MSPNGQEYIKYSFTEANYNLGGLSTVSTASECMLKCDGIPQCLAAMFEGTNCQLKYTTIALLNGDTSASLSSSWYEKVMSECQWT